MRKSLVVIGTVLLSALVASASDTAKYETFLGYDFVGLYPNNNFTPKAHFNGGSGQFVYNFGKYFSGVFDAGAVHKGLIGGYDVDTTVAHYVAGPRARWSHGRFNPYIQALFGGAYGTTSTQVSALIPAGGLLPPAIIITPNTPVSARLHASQDVFAMLVGGGLDIKVSKRMAIRPIGFDYFQTRFSNPQLGTNTQDNWRYTAGINFMFGAH